jgi:PAS domain S-box-containing protein
MSAPLRVLIVEDSEDDTLLLLRELRRGGYAPTFERVDTPAAMNAALDHAPWDLIISDYTMPRFGALAAFSLLKQRGLDVPFIILSGTVGEETAAEAMRVGAHDYIMKDNLTRLLPAIERELREVAGRRTQREAQRILRESEDRFRLFVESVKDYAIVMLDPSGRVVSWNAGVERITGYRSEEILGRHFSCFYTAEAAQRGEPAESLKVAAAEGRLEHNGWRVRRDGSRFWAQSAIMALRDPARQLRGFAKVIRDITERQQLEEVLQQQMGELAEADRRKNEFLAMLAHELRNPLAPLRNAAHVLRLRGADAAAVARARDVVERQVHHMTRLVDDLLDVSRIIRGKILLRCQRLDLTRLVRDTVQDHRSALEQSGLTLDLELPQAPVWVMGDPTRLAQVLDNLLQNAAKFTDPGGRVTVRLSVEERQDFATITVHDTGIGITPELLPHVFESFTQADRSLDRSRGGLGLGLALVKGLIERHGGAVRATSAGPGYGAAFGISLPLEQRPAAPEAPPAPASLSARPQRILVVEDNSDAADTLRDLLELFGHEVEVAYSGPAGVAAARQFRPEVVLCDLGLPGVDGYAVAAALRQDPATASVRLIAVSGYGREEDRRRCREAGFDHHLTKPVEPGELERLLATLPARS